MKIERKLARTYFPILLNSEQWALKKAYYITVSNNRPAAK